MGDFHQKCFFFTENLIVVLKQLIFFFFFPLELLPFHGKNRLFSENLYAEPEIPPCTPKEQDLKGLH